MADPNTKDFVLPQEVDAPYLAKWFARAMARSVIGEGGCWIWAGPLHTKGYGYTSWHGQNVAIHRKMFEISRGVLLTTEQFACHTCDNRACWNPTHLFLGDAEANNNDCAGKGRHHNTVKTHCKYGHEYSPENTELRTLATGSVTRVCLTCRDLYHRREKYVEWRRAYQKRRRAQKRAAAQQEG